MNNIAGDVSKVALQNIRLTIVCDNYPYLEELSTDWGFSCLIQGTEKTILFDTGGNSTILLQNMMQLGIDPRSVDLVVLSHIHADHVGGLEGFLRSNNNVFLFFPASFPARFKSSLIKSGVLFHEIHDPSPICQGVYSTGELGLRIKEQSLIICTDQGFILITGCAHPGIVQIVRTARGLLQESPLMVIGGFHLAQKNASELKGIISNMKDLGVRYAAPCHCSGDLTRQMFDAAFGDQYIAGGVGRIIRFDANNRACSDLNEPIENAGNR